MESEQQLGTQCSTLENLVKSSQTQTKLENLVKPSQSLFNPAKPSRTQSNSVIPSPYSVKPSKTQ